MTNDLSILLCILCSSGAGLGAGFFGCILSWANHEKRRNLGQHTSCSQCVAIFGVVGSTIFGVGSLAGLYFGPVVLVVVIRAGTLLPANAVFSQIFGFRPLTRDDLLGTLVTVSGVVCFSLFSGTPPPAPKEDEYLVALFSCGAMICNSVLLVIFLGSLAVALTDQGAGGSIKMAIAVANVSGCSSAFMDLAAKGWSAVLDSGGVNHAWTSLLFWGALLINIVFLLAMRVSMIYGCKRCDILLFVPLSTVSNIFYSVLAGMAVLKEYKQVISWPGLLAASVSVLGGVVMLVSGPARSDDDEYPGGEEEHSDIEESALVPLAPESDFQEGPSSSRSDRSTESTLMPGGFLGSFFRTKGQELVYMNHSHWEAARIRQRWQKWKQHLRERVGETHFRHKRKVSKRLSRVSPQNTEQGPHEEDSDSEDSDSS